MGSLVGLGREGQRSKLKLCYVSLEGVQLAGQVMDTYRCYTKLC